MDHVLKGDEGFGLRLLFRARSIDPASGWIVRAALPPAWARPRCARLEPCNESWFSGYAVAALQRKAAFWGRRRRAPAEGDVLGTPSPCSSGRRRSGDAIAALGSRIYTAFMAIVASAGMAAAMRMDAKQPLDFFSKRARRSVAFFSRVSSASSASISARFEIDSLMAFAP